MSKWTIIILGASGDLSKKNIIPALCGLIKHKPDFEFIFIGTAKDDITKEKLLESANISLVDREQFLNVLNERSTYYMLDFDDQEEFKKFAQFIEKYEQENNMPGNRLVYLAVAAQLYCSITKKLIVSGIIKHESQLRSNLKNIVTYEKPFGWDLESSESINQCVNNLISNNQIYRVDHYLTKALVSSMVSIRFSNSIFEHIWNNNYIDQVQIIFSEDISIAGRGAFYDRFGAIKDVLQNHMLQLLSLVAMEKPKTLEGQDISEAKCNVLKNAVIQEGITGQYIGYQEEKAVKSASTTETFAILKCAINTPRWHNVPFYLKTGKNLDRQVTEIRVILKAVNKNIFSLNGFYDPNIITFCISPSSDFSLRLNMQQHSLHNNISNVIPISMDFCYNCFFGCDLPLSYETLIYDIINGDKSISVNFDEIKYAWLLLESLKKLKLPLYEYQIGTNGPKEAQNFAEKYNIMWR